MQVCELTPDNSVLLPQEPVGSRKDPQYLKLLIVGAVSAPRKAVAINKEPAMDLPNLGIDSVKARFNVCLHLIKRQTQA
jgi:hypothetical protein